MNREPLGARLKKIRQEKGLSLEEVRKKTKIHLNILKAIEGDSLTNLSPVYLKGFLKIYCNFLGLDPKECNPDYQEAAPVSSTIVFPQKEKKTLKPPAFLENATLRWDSLGPHKRIKNIIILALAIIALGVVFFNAGKFIFSKPQTKPKILAQAPRASLQPAEKIKAPKKFSEGVSLVISAKENSLILVKVDGRVVMHRVLERGRSDSWRAKEKIELSLSNAAAVELIVNGQRFSKLGRRGQQLKNIVITEKDGLRIPR
ncbi:MAG: helix-turn-helix domain-containing protein [Candidatus Omnitrophota bacterium]|jgi:cytoskeletal protein RodZ